MTQRIIKFRGRSLTGKSAYHPGGEWVYGYYCVNRFDEHTIFLEDEENAFAKAVHKESIGQFTGLLDKNGKEIYEGDIVEWQPKNGAKERTVVNWDNERTRFACDVYGFNEKETKERIEVIGNIYENPSLLTHKK